MKAVSVLEISPTTWDEVCLRSLQAWIFHRHSWIELEARQSASKNRSFALVSGGRIVAIMPLFISTLDLGGFSELLVHSGLHRHTGLALAPDLGSNEIRATQNASMRTILNIAREIDADRIYLGHQNLSQESLSSARAEIPFWAIDHGFQLGNSFGPFGLAPGPGLASTVVDQIIALTESEEKLFESLTKSCRYTIRVAMRGGFEVLNLTTSETCVSDYYRLARLSAERTGEMLPERAYYDAIRGQLASAGMCSFLFATHNGKFAAAAILLHEKGSVQYFSGVSDPSYLARGVNDLLQWEAILFAKRSGNSYYRLGPYFPGLPSEWPVSKVSRFKSKFGAQAMTIVQGSKFLKPQRYRQLAQDHIARLCSELAE